METGDIFEVAKDNVIWNDHNDRINGFPTILYGGFYIQQPFRISKGEIITIETTGPAIIYIVFERGARGGGFQSSLPSDEFIREIGEIKTASSSQDLSMIFSRKFDSEITHSLPATTTQKTVMLIIVKPYCTGICI